MGRLGRRSRRKTSARVRLRRSVRRGLREQNQLLSIRLHLRCRYHESEIVEQEELEFELVEFWEREATDLE